MSTNTWLIWASVSVLVACSQEAYSSKEGDPAVEMIQIADDFSDSSEWGVLPELVLKDFDFGHSVAVDFIQDAGMVEDTGSIEVESGLEDGAFPTDRFQRVDASPSFDGAIQEDVLDASAPLEVPDTVVTFVTMEYPAIVLEVEAFTHWQQAHEWQVEEVVLGGDVAVAILDSDLYDPTLFCGLRINAFIYQDEEDLNDQQLIVGESDRSLCQTTLLPDGSAHYRIQANMAVWIDVNGFQYGIESLEPMPSADGMHCDTVLFLSSRPVCSAP